MELNKICQKYQELTRELGQKESIKSQEVRGVEELRNRIFNPLNKIEKNNNE